MGTWGQGAPEPRQKCLKSVSVCDDQSTDRTFPLGGHSEPHPWRGSGEGFLFPFPRGRPGRRCRGWGKGAALLAWLLPLGLTSVLLPHRSTAPRQPPGFCSGLSPGAGWRGPHLPHQVRLCLRLSFILPLGAPHPTGPLFCRHNPGNP